MGARNIGEHLEGYLANKPGDYKPMVRFFEDLLLSPR